MTDHIANVILSAVCVSLAHDAAAVLAMWPDWMVRAWAVLTCVSLAFVGFGCLFVLTFVYGLCGAVRAERRERKAQP